MITETNKHIDELEEIEGALRIDANLPCDRAATLREKHDHILALLGVRGYKTFFKRFTDGRKLFAAYGEDQILVFWDGMFSKRFTGSVAKIWKEIVNNN